MTTATAFGVSRVLEAPTRTLFTTFLRSAWMCQFAREPGSVSEDLDLLRKWFRPDLSGKFARGQVLEISRLPREIPSDLTAEAVVPLPGHRCLVAPEGRLLLEILEEENDAISDTVLLRATALLSQFYGQGYHKRLAGMLSGGDARPNTLAFVVFLMLNGSVGEEQSFVVPEDPVQETHLAKAVFGVLDVFVAGIGGSPLGADQRKRLRSNWVLTESWPQFPFLVAHMGDAYWLREDEDEIPEELGRVLAARRSVPSIEELDETLDETLAAYTAGRPVLSAQDLAFYRPSRAKADLKRLVSAYADRIHL